MSWLQSKAERIKRLLRKAKHSMGGNARNRLDRRKLTRIGLILIVGGIMLSIDGIGSILAEFNTHSFLSDLERLFRTIGGVLLAFLGAYVYKYAN
jgi:hypothetical protein